MQQEIWFDVDDVLVDTATQIHRSMLSRTQKDIPISSWENLMFTSLYQLGEGRASEMRAWWEEDQIIEKSTLYPHTVALLGSLSNAGYRIGLITARAWHPRARELTEDFISKNKLPVSDLKLLKFDESKKELLRPHAKQTVAFIDDSTHHVKGALELNIPSVLMRRSWNMKETEIHAIENLEQMESHFKLFSTSSLKKLKIGL